MLFEGPVAAAADDPDITGAQPAAQLRQHAELVITPVNLTAGHHIASPSLADEAGRAGFGSLSVPASFMSRSTSTARSSEAAAGTPWNETVPSPARRRGLAPRLSKGHVISVIVEAQIAKFDLCPPDIVFR